uniref:Asialoglycoprotein receptor 2-like n=1 Tax=Erpetoichthys calabaricus TaxID=27687 RepID=A0A8C4T0E7_ERPCA
MADQVLYSSVVFSQRNQQPEVDSKKPKDQNEDVTYAEVKPKKKQQMDSGPQAGAHAESDTYCNIDQKMAGIDKQSNVNKSTDILVPPTKKKNKTFLMWLLLTFLCAVFLAAIAGVIVFFVLNHKYKENQINQEKLEQNLSNTNEELRILHENFTVQKDQLLNLKTQYIALNQSHTALQSQNMNLTQSFSDLQMRHSALQGNHSALTTSLNKYCSLQDVSKPERQCVFCPESWVPFNTKCYYFSTNKLSWNDSRDNCTSMGGHLVIIESQEEQSFLLNKTISKTDKSHWIGLTDQKIEGQYLWVDNRLLNENNKFWGQRDNQNDHGYEPDNFKGDHKEGEHCIHLNKNTLFNGWYDAWCGEIKQRICEAAAALIHI